MCCGKGILFLTHPPLLICWPHIQAWNWYRQTNLPVTSTTQVVTSRLDFTCFYKNAVGCVDIVFLDRLKVTREKELRRKVNVAEGKRQRERCRSVLPNDGLSFQTALSVRHEWGWGGFHFKCLLVPSDVTFRFDESTELFRSLRQRQVGSCRLQVWSTSFNSFKNTDGWW